jgi:hypothetical protein
MPTKARAAVRVSNAFDAFANFDEEEWPRPSIGGDRPHIRRPRLCEAKRCKQRACCVLRHSAEATQPLMAVKECSWGGKKWAQLELAVDSGAVATVIPAVPGIEVKPSEASRAGRCYQTADGGEIPNLGEQRLRGYTDELQPCSITAQVADVMMPLLSVACVSEQGNTFHFGAKAGYIQHVASGRVTRLAKRGKLYYLRMWVELPEATSFGRQ